MFDDFPKGGVYMIKNNKTGKHYIGSAIDLERRKKDHFRMLRGGYHHSKKLQNSFNKHGEQCFEFCVIVRIADKSQLVPVEQTYIDFYESAGKNGYNSRPIAASNLGHKFSAETCEKNRQARVGKKQSVELVHFIQGFNNELRGIQNCSSPVACQ